MTHPHVSSTSVCLSVCVCVHGSVIISPPCEIKRGADNQVTAAEDREAYIHGIIVTVNITCLTYIIHSMGIFYTAALDGAAVLRVASMREIMTRCLFFGNSGGFSQ